MSDCGSRPEVVESADGVRPVADQDDGRHESVLAAVTAILPGPGGSVTVAIQKGGPFAGRWMLPGGRIEIGETALEAAVRECREEVGITPSNLDVVGIYEIIGCWGDGTPFQIQMTAFLAGRAEVVPQGFAGDNGGGIRQARVSVEASHSSDLRILRDAGLLETADHVVEQMLTRDGLHVSRIDPHRGSGPVDHGALAAELRR